MSLHPWLKKMTITLFGHPARARKMAIIHALGAVWFSLGVDAEDERNGFAPICTFRLRVE